MALSLRFVFAGVTAFIVLIVAASTLAITLTVSLNAVHNTGTSLALAIENTVQTQVETWLSVVEQHALQYQTMVKRPEFLLPTNDSDPSWWDKWMIPLRVAIVNTNYEYTSMSIIFDDGGIMTALPMNYADAYALIVADQHTLALTGKVTYRAWLYNQTTQQFWSTSIWGPEPLLLVQSGDQRVPGYYSILTFTARKPACFWVPPALNALSGVGSGQFILYGTCTLFNSSKVLMGTINVGRPLDGVGKFLQGTTKTPNTQIVIVDNYNLLVASTYSAQFQFQYDPSVKSAADNCVSNLDTSPAGSPKVIGCRSYATDYPYAPLQSIASSDPAFVVTAGLQQRYGTLGGDAYYYISSRIASQLSGYSMNLVLFMPESDVLGDIITGRNIAIIVTALVFLFAAGLSVVFTGALLKPLDDVAGRMYRTAQLDDSVEFASMRELDDEVAHRASIEGGQPEETLLQVPMSESNFTEIKALQLAYTTMDTAIKSFTRYVPRDVVKELMATNQMCEIAMRPTRCSMLFTDIASFTSICERVPPHILSRLVRLFFERSSALVMWHGGVIDKFIGDCIMAVFGAPVPVDHGEIRAAVCGRMLVQDTSSDPLKTEFKNAGETLGIRVGVASGEVLAGNMGSEMRMSYTVIGDNVNLASRLEGLNKSWGTQVMVSQATAEECNSYLAMRFVVQVAVVGKQEPVRVYEVLGVLPDANTEAVGAFTSEASEDVTVQQARYAEAKKELDAAYGTKSSGGGPTSTVVSVGKILRRCMRKVTVTAEELHFAEVYTHAMEAYLEANFAKAVSLLEGLAHDAGAPTGCDEHKSVQRLLHAAMSYLAHPPDASFNGVFVADEK